MSNYEKMFEAMYDSALKFLVPLTPQNTYTNIVKEAMHITGADYGNIVMREQGKFKKVYSTSPESYKIRNRPYGNTYRAYKDRQPLIAPIKELATAHPKLVELGVKWVVFLPLSYQKRSIGVLTLFFTKDTKMAKNELQSLKIFGSMASLAIRKAQLYATEKRALEMRNQFISLIAHELRTPLTSISGYIQLLHKRKKDQNDVESKWIKEINSETMRLSNLINEILEVNRIESKKQQYSFSPVNIVDCSKKAIETIRRTYPSHSFKISNSLPEDEEMIIADPDKVHQLLVSLLDNAAKFSNSDSKITVSLENTKKYVVVNVEDQGKGISSQDMPYVFEGFYKGQENHNVGMGLGLLLVKEIVSHHKGKVTINSKKDHGTIITVQFPKIKL